MRQSALRRNEGAEADGNDRPPGNWGNSRKDAYVAATTATGSAVYTEITDNKSVEIPLSKAELSNSVMGDGAETFFPGLISAPISATFRQSFESGGADAFFWARWNGEAKFRLKVRPKDAAVSTMNPSYIFNRVAVFGITPISGQHGALLENAVQMRILSGGTVTRSTST